MPVIQDQAGKTVHLSAAGQTIRCQIRQTSGGYVQQHITAQLSTQQALELADALEQLITQARAVQPQGVQA